MSKVVKGNKKVAEKNTFESLQALYFSGKVKPSLNKILAELAHDDQNIELSLLACKCMVRTKNFEELSLMADKIIEISPQTAEAYYLKGIAFQNTKGSEQEAIKNFNEALALEPENLVFLNAKATTHLFLFTDYNLPLNFATKHRNIAEKCLSKIIDLIEAHENHDFINYFTAGDASMTLTKNMDAKKYYLRAVSDFEAADESLKDMNIYKELIKAQKACARLIEKFTE